MERRKFVKKSAAAGLGLVGLSNHALSAMPADEKRSITIIHTNDMHSHIEAFDDDHPKYPGQGGMAERAAAIDKIRAEHGDILLLDAGDIFQGTPYFNYFDGHLELDLMSKMGYDAATMGNHDFDIGLDGFASAKEKAKFPFICSNYDFEDTLLAGKTISHKVFKKNGIRIGVFGLGIELEGLVDPRLCEGVRYNNPVDVSRRMVTRLKNEKNCDLVICLSHLGYMYKSDKVSDHVLAEEVEGIDLIIGGHTHTLLDMPTIIEKKDASATYINQVGWAGIRLGQVQFEMSKEGSKKNLSAVSLDVKGMS